MNTLTTQIAQYALKEELRTLVEDAMADSAGYTTSNRINALGESPKQQFERLLLEGEEEGIQYPDKIESEQHTEKVREAPYWKPYAPSTQGLRYDEHIKPYALSSQYSNVIPHHTVTQSTEYDVKYSPYSLNLLRVRPSGSTEIASQTHWRYFKGVHTAHTVHSSFTGDDILRSMGIVEPRYIEPTKYFTDTTPPAEFSYGRETFNTQSGTISSMEDPMTLMAIQSKMMTFPVAASITNTTFKKTEENLDQISKGE